MNNKKQLFLAIFLAIAVIIAVVYWVSTRVPKSEDVAADSMVAGVAFTEGEEVLKMLEILQSTKLDLNLFSDPVFQGLVDYSVELIPEPVGRDNPFLPLGASGPEDEDEI